MKMNFSQNDEERVVLFLCIEGVLLPNNKAMHGKRYEITKEDAPSFLESVAEKTGVERVHQMDYMDIAAAYLDWESEAVRNLKRILGTLYRQIEIIVTTMRMDPITLEDVKAWFAIHELDEYVTGICRFTDSESQSIAEYLNEHSQLKNYVILSAQNHLRQFAGHAIMCESSWLDTRTANQVERIFKNGFWWDYRPLEANDFIEDHMEKVVFLDIDGVLNTFGKGPIVEERMVALLKNEIIKPTGAEIVLTSAWRSRLGSWAYAHFTDSDDYWDCNKLIEVLALYGINIADRTPQVKNGPEGRPFEVRLWLAHHPHVKHFVILDDEPFWEWYWLKPYVVETYEYDADHKMICGLTAEKAKTAREILLSKQGESK